MSKFMLRDGTKLFGSLGFSNKVWSSLFEHVDLSLPSLFSLKMTEIVREKLSATKTSVSHVSKKIVKKGADTINPSTLYKVGVAGARKVVSCHGAEIDKEIEVQKAKASILGTLNNHQYLKIFEFLQTFIGHEAGRQVFQGVVADIFPDKRSFIDLIEINGVRGLSNFVQEMYANRANIPNFDHQPAWLNSLFFLYHAVSRVLNTERLTKIEERLQAILDDIWQQRELLDIKSDNTPEKMALWEACIATDDEEKQIDILSMLYGTWIGEEIEKNAEMRFFYKNESEFIKSLFVQDPDFSKLFTLLNKKSSYRLEIVSFFSDVADIAVEKLFPNKILDMEVPGILKKGPLPGFIYGFFQDSIKNAFTNHYLASKEKFTLLLSMIENGIPQLVNLFDIESLRNQLREASGGELLVSFAHALSVDITTGITNKILNEKKLVHDILRFLGKEHPTDEEIEKMQSALQNLIFSLGRKKISFTDLEELLKKTFGEEAHGKGQSLLEVLFTLEENVLPKDLVLKVLLEKTIVKLASDQGLDEAEISIRIAEIKLLSAEEIITLDEKKSLEELRKEVKTALDLLCQWFPEEISYGLSEGYTQEEISQLLESIIYDNGLNKKSKKIQLEKIAEEIVLEMSFRGEEEFSKEDISVVLNKIVDEYEKKLFEIKQITQALNDQAQELTHSIQDRVISVGKENLNVADVVDAFKKTFHIEFVNPVKEKTLKPLIEKRQGALILEEEVANSIQERLSPDSMDVKPFIMDQLHGMLFSVDPSYKKNREFLQGLFEGILLKIFTAAATINPPQDGKSFEVLIVERFLMLLGEFIENLSGSEGLEEIGEIAKGFSELLLASVLGIAHVQVKEGKPQLVLSEQLNWIPESFREKVLNLVTGGLADALVSRLAHLSKLDSDNENVQATKEKLKGYDKVLGQERSNTEIVVEDLMRLVMPAVLNSLVKESEGSSHLSGVTKISSAIESLIESLMVEGNQEYAKLLFNYDGGESFKEILGAQLSAIAGSEYQENKEKVLNRVVNLLLAPMDRIIEEAVNFGSEKAHKRVEAIQKVMGNMFKAGGPHFRMYARAQRLARWDGRNQVAYPDLMRAGGNGIHAAVPRQVINYQQTIEAIKEIVPDLTEDQVYTIRKRIMHLVRKEKNKIKTISHQDIINEVEFIYRYASADRALNENQVHLLTCRNKDGKTIRDIIREEADAHSMQRNAFGFNPASKKVAKLMFPNGKDDLTFVPAEDRAAVWKLLKKSLLPMTFSIITESVLSPVAIKSILLTCLKETNNSLNKKAEIPGEEIPGVGGPAESLLGDGAGDVFAGIIEAMELPGVIKNALIDPATGQIYPSMKHTLGKTLAKQFNENFIEETIKNALAALSKRDENGNPVLNYDGRPEAIKKAEAIAMRIRTTEEIYKEAHGLVKASISNYVRTTWVVSQDKFDKSIQKFFGKFGLGVKHVLDAIFKFMFFKMIEPVLSMLLFPVEDLTIKMINRMISLDKNIDTLLAMVQIPEDQPEGYDYSIFNENLIYQMMEAMGKTVVEVANGPKEEVVIV